MQILHPGIENYIANHTKTLHPILDELEKETIKNIPMPNMISGKEQGTFLNLMVGALNPKKVLEIGTYTGYSAICMALAMEKDSSLITYDKNKDVIEVANKYIKRIGLDDVIETKLCEAIDELTKWEDGSIDLIFIDADKSQYPNYLEISKKKIRKGGYILIDNVLWKGKVIEENPDNRTKAIMKTNDIAFQDNDFTSLISPLRDGLLMIRKK